LEEKEAKEAAGLLLGQLRVANRPEAEAEEDDGDDLAPDRAQVNRILLTEGLSDDQVFALRDEAATKRAADLLKKAKLSDPSRVSGPRGVRGLLQWPNVLDTGRMESLLAELLEFNRNTAPYSITDATFNRGDDPSKISVDGAKIMRLLGIAYVLGELSTISMEKMPVSFSQNLFNATQSFFTNFDRQFNYMLVKIDENIRRRPAFNQLLRNIAVQGNVR